MRYTHARLSTVCKHYLPSSRDCLLFMGAGGFLGGTFLTSRRWRGHIFLATHLLGGTFLAQFFLNPTKAHFLRVSGKNKTRKNLTNMFVGEALFWQVAYGGTYFWQVRPPPPINN